MTAAVVLPGADEALVAAQFEDRAHLRPVLDAVLAAALRVGEVRVVARRRQVSLVGPLRTFAMVQASTRARLDVALRIDAPVTGARAVATRGVEFRVRLELRRAEDVDGEAVDWLRRAYEANAAARTRRRPVPRGRPLGESVVRLVIEANDLPGRTCAPPDAGGRRYENVHVGLRSNDGSAAGALALTPRRPWVVVDLVPGDAPAARWEVDVTVRRFADGHDVRGVHVFGERGERMVALAWGVLRPDTGFALFRGLGLRFKDVDPALLDLAAEADRRLVARLGLTDRKGNPRCASVRPPDVAWSVEPAS